LRYRRLRGDFRDPKGVLRDLMFLMGARKEGRAFPPDFFLLRHRN